MLFIKGIYLLFSHLPTSHTTVRAVRHTVVSCFYTLRCVASCFQPSLRDTSLLFYCRIPSYRVNRVYSVMVHRIPHLHHASVKSPRIRALSFHLIPTSFFRKLKETPPTVPNSYRALICLATLPTVICLIWSFCPLGQMFAAGFFKIPPHDEHPCLWLCNSRY